LPLPAGWSIAEDNANSQAVIGDHRWSTDFVVTNGRSFYTSRFGPSYAGTQFGTSTTLLDADGSNNYKIDICSGQILIIAATN
jgi:hypothetical protein